MWPLPLRRFWYHRKARGVMAGFLSTELPSRSSHWRDVSWLAVDLETTALSSSDGEIASIGWVPIDNGMIKIEQAEHHYLAIQEGVGQSAVFHHIRDAELTDAQSIRPVMERFLEVAAGKVLIFHNAQLDMSFLNKISRQLFGTPLLVPISDTLLLEKQRLLRRLQELPRDSLRLHSCRKRYGLPDYPAHDALTDALATAELLLAWVAHAGDDVVLADCMRQ